MNASSALRAGLGLLALSLLARAAVSWGTEPTSLETYIWLCGRHPAAGYFDYPGVGPWLSFLSCAAFGNSTLGLRALFLAAAGLLAAVVGLTARRLYGPAAGLRATALAALLPLFFAYGAVALPDAPLLLFWASTLWAAARALSGDSPRWWWAAGAFLGLAMLSKYTALLLAPALLAFLALSPEHRFWLRRREPWIGVGIAALLQAPTLAWNAAHGWQSFLYQGVERFGEGGAEARQAYAFPLGQLLLMTPGVGLLALGAAALAFRRWKSTPWQDRYLAVAGLPILLFFASLLISRPVRGHWPAPAWISLTILAASRGSRPARWIVDASLALLATACLALPVVLYTRPAEELRGWSALARRVAEFRPDFVVAQDYHAGAQLAYHLRPVPAFDFTPLGKTRKNFAAWWSAPPFRGGSAVVVYEVKRHPQDLELARSAFEELGEPVRVSLVRPGGRREDYLLIPARGYRGERP